MLRARISTWKILAAVALAVLVQSQLASTVVSAGQGRDLHACVQTCNDLKAECGDACQNDCGVLFARGTTEFNDCVTACSNTCSDEMQLCKAKCNPQKTPSPNEP
ncbi:MAG TPA: hypothetical protein VNI57_11245 [Candidatus Saccharimonadales bacterium]|nr:hypothetical protein [Candidatus Saccharimonadales bacterium]